MAKFLGAHERSLDEKGRLALPTGYRANLGPTFVVTVGADNSIEVFTEERFDLEADRLAEMEARGEVSLDRLRAFTARAVEVSPDQQGRIYLDERLRRHANLEVKKPLMVFGRRDRVEICAVDRYERSMTAGEYEFSERRPGIT